MYKYPLLWLAAGGAALYALTSRTKTGDDLQTYTGRSGLKWRVQTVKRIGDDRWVDVFTTNNERVIRYVQRVNGDRQLVVRNPQAGNSLINSAMADFGVKAS